MEIKPAINAAIRSLLLLNRSRPYQSERPPLELIRILLRQGTGILEARRFPNDLELTLLTEGITESVTYQRYGQVRHINPDPAPGELLGRRNGRAPTAEQIENHVTFIAACFNDALKQTDGFLRRIAKTFGSLGAERLDIGPDVRAIAF